MSSGIFLITDGENLKEMESSLYESEDALQSLVAQFPRLLSSYSEGGNAVQWLLVKREIGVPERENGSARWSLDHLFIDDQGIPVLVEVKRSTDTRIRREVVGQMLDYAANAVAYWPIEHIQSSFIAECEKNGDDSAEKLESFLGERMSEDAFWTTVKTNLQAGRIRMLFVADQIPNELKRIIEFMNEQMDPAEVLGIELKHFTDGKFRTIVPAVFGQTSMAQSRKKSFLGQADEDLEESVRLFNEMQFKPYFAEGGGWAYRQVKVPNFPKKLHYEFLSRKKTGITAEFHIEDVKYKELSKVLIGLQNEFPEINGGQVLFDQDWNEGKGRLRVVQNNNSSQIAASTMVELIRKTKEKIAIGINRIDLDTKEN
jgi:hypothetical protein